MNSLSTNPYFWLCYFTIASGMAYWNHRRGHSFIIGLFISVICTPVVALLFILFGKPNTAEIRKREKDRLAQSPEMMRCPSCTALIPKASARCKECGKKFSTNES